MFESTLDANDERVLASLSRSVLPLIRQRQARGFRTQRAALAGLAAAALGLLVVGTGQRGHWLRPPASPAPQAFAVAAADWDDDMAGTFSTEAADDVASDGDEEEPAEVE
jgi:hypothetical protein